MLYCRKLYYMRNINIVLIYRIIFDLVRFQFNILAWLRSEVKILFQYRNDQEL